MGSDEIVFIEAKKRGIPNFVVGAVGEEFSSKITYAEARVSFRLESLGTRLVKED